MFLVSSCSCLCPICWSHVLSWDWRCSWSSADRRCSDYIWVINHLIAYKCASYIRDLMVCIYSKQIYPMYFPCIWNLRARHSVWIVSAIYPLNSAFLMSVYIYDASSSGGNMQKNGYLWYYHGNVGWNPGFISFNETKKIGFMVAKYIMNEFTSALCQYPRRCLIVRFRKVSKQRDLYLELSDRSEIW